MTNLQTYIAPRNEILIRADSAILAAMWIENAPRHLAYHIARYQIRCEIIRLRQLRASPNWKDEQFVSWLKRQEHIRLDRIRNIYRNRPDGRIMRARLIAQGQRDVFSTMIPWSENRSPLGPKS